MHRWNLLVAAHAIGATFALMVGLVVLRTPRKGNRFHRRLGMTWMAAMYWTALSSFGIKELRPGHFSWIHGLSLWTLFSLTMALWAAKTRRREVHRVWVVGSYFGLIGAGLAAMAFPMRLAPQLLVHRPLVFAGAVSAVAVVTAVVVRLARRQASSANANGSTVAAPARRSSRPANAIVQPVSTRSSTSSTTASSSARNAAAWSGVTANRP
jgi:uncharacterized membrane protein